MALILNGLSFRLVMLTCITVLSYSKQITWVWLAKNQLEPNICYLEYIFEKYYYILRLKQLVKKVDSYSALLGWSSTSIFVASDIS